ncbi:SGNH/GDSL hydrolase family protein [Devosia sp. YIM 151766]|uniref:SGNH/GDSL hydrolase family protein n=1 Tax=Devosia sp. YIM 151766 TaxID=3017325 RepID=UPI00255C51D4|nr:SGNH/GDSL hydrolase family protein [Devosia sp. YIM 151766]WIY54336.1 SGNH/GDSL hydrolase family protein [Devosia sp. YIM 151766]
MKTILAYGDSLTYGADPGDGPRHAYEDRWPTRLEMGLGSQARVIAEGLGGRATAYDDWTAAADRNGARILPTLLDSHKPLDLVILFLGTNDLKPFVAGSAAYAARGARRLIEMTRGHFAGTAEPAPQIILVSPPHVVETTNENMLSNFGGLDHLLRESHDFARHYRRHAEETGVAFFDAATVAKADPRDGVHLDAANTRAIGEGLVPLVKQILGL